MSSYNVTLKRIFKNEHGTFGVMSNDNGPMCLTLERPWLDNKKDVSCVPLGKYDCVKHNSVKFPNVFELLNVPNRDEILIHAGNSIDDTHGCILVGCQFMPYGLTLSRLALEDLRKRLPDKFTLTIKE